MAKFYSEDSCLVKDAKLDKGEFVSDLKTDVEFREFFETERVVRWIQEGGFRRTALQLPDGFLSHAYRLSSIIEAECGGGAKVYILADTGYRSCCIDDIAAQHANCDSLVHFGESCLSKTTERIPVLYVFGKFPLNMDSFRQKWTDFLKTTELSDTTTICLLYDSVFSHLKDQLSECIRQELSSTTNVLSFNLADNDQNSSENSKITLGRIFPTSFDDQASKSLLVFVGAKDSRLLPIWLMTFPSFNHYVHYAPEEDTLSYESSASNRLLRKRLFLIEKLRDANVIGLVVGTLEIKGYKEAIQRVREICKAAAKKLYVLSIGKLNEAKLSNFSSDIDGFIMLSCPFGIVLERTKVYNLVVSMFEAEIALNSSKEWFASSGWTAEFDTFTNDEIRSEDASRTDVSLITGKVRAMQVVEDDSGDKNRQLITYSAGDYFANKSWKGLDDGYHQDDSLEIKKGLAGTSMGYTSEKSN